MSLNLKMLGTNIQSKRKSKHLNQEELAYRVGISRNYLSMIETGKKEVSITYLVELAENLECTVNDFLIGSQNYDTTDTAREIEDLLLDCILSTQGASTYSFGVISITLSSEPSLAGRSSVKVSLSLATLR